MLFRCSKLQLAVTLYLVAMMADPSFATKATNSNMQVEENWWKMFDQFHKDRQSEFARDQEKQDRKIEQDAAAAKKALESEKIDSTQASMTAQESVLLSPASAAKKQDARIYYIRDALELAFLLRFTDQSQRQKILTKVEQLIADARKNPLSSIQYGEIGFLEAGYYESIKQRDRVIATLNTLCKSATQTSEAVVAACVKSGDFVFQAESYEKAQKFYDTAEKAAKIVKLPAHSPLLADIQYRLAWTNYRSGNIEVVVKNSQQFLSGDIRRRYDDDTRRMKLDIAELLGNSLFEINDYDLIKKTLISLKAMKFADHAATMIVERFHDAKLYDQQLAFTDFLLQHFGTAAEMPTWLILGA